MDTALNGTQKWPPSHCWAMTRNIIKSNNSKKDKATEFKHVFVNLVYYKCFCITFTDFQEYRYFTSPSTLLNCHSNKESKTISNYKDVTILKTHLFIVHFIEIQSELLSYKDCTLPIVLLL